MSFPSSTTSIVTTFSSSVTSMAVDLPSSISSGSLLIAAVSVRNSGTWSTIPSGWTQLFAPVASGGVGDLTVFYRIADGLEGSTSTWVASVATTASWDVRKITDWHGTTPPEAATSNSGGVAGTNANPPSLTPSWGAADTLWFAVGGAAAESVTLTSAPANYGSDAVWTNVSAGGASCSIGSSYRQLNAASEDPGSYTTAASRWWYAATVAIRPTVGGGGSPNTAAFFALF